MSDTLAKPVDPAEAESTATKPANAPAPADVTAPADTEPQVEPPGTVIARSERQLVAVLITVGFVLIAVAIRLRVLYGYPAGDEPAYLVISQTLQKYHSVDVMKDYLNADYRSFYPALLDPHVVTAANGKMEPLHNIGGPLLWLLPFMIWGKLGAFGFMGFISLLIIGNVYYFLRERGIAAPYAFGTTLLLTIGSPIYTYASMAFVEPIGALFILYAMRVLLAPRVSTPRLLVASLGLAYLPWVHSRFLLFTFIIGALFLLRIYRESGLASLRPYLWLLSPLALSFIGTVLYNLLLWGTPNPVSNMSNAGAGPFQIPLSKGFAGTFFDRQVGLIPNFPIFVLLLPGLLLSLNRSRLRVQGVLFAVVLLYLLLICTFAAWWAGFSPPARYVMVVLPLLSYYVAVALQRLNSAIVTCAAVAVSLGSYALGIASDLVPLDRFAWPGQGGDINPPMDRLSNLFHVRFVQHIPSGFEANQGPLFLLWCGAVGAIGVGLWLVGIRKPELPGEQWASRGAVTAGAR